MRFFFALIVCFLAAAAVLAFASFASATTVTDISCTQDSDCGSGAICQSGVCSVKEGPTISVTFTQLSACGDGSLDSGEECDDGNTTAGDGCNASCQNEAAPSPGGTFVRPFPQPTNVIFEGKAYPNAFVAILKNGAVAATVAAQGNGSFTANLSGVSGGTYTFSVWAEDNEGRQSTTLSFTVTILARTTTYISGIILPPTIELSAPVIAKGQELGIAGQSFPRAAIKILISPLNMIKQAFADERGRWKYGLDTKDFSVGEYGVQAMALSDSGGQSGFSDKKTFKILPEGAEICAKGDLNHDGKVELADLSIMLHWWGTDNTCADQNHDGIVDLIDISILFYYWRE